MVPPECCPNREHLLVSFTEQAAAKHTGHRAEVLMAKRTLHPLLASARTIRQQWQRGFSHCELPAAVLFKELTWHWYNVRTSTMRTTFDLGNKFWSVGSVRGYWVGGKIKSLAAAPGDCAGAEEWVSNGTVSGITPRCRTRPKSWQNEMVRLTRRCRVSARAQAGSCQLLSQGWGLGHKFSSQGGTGWREEEFWLLYAWQPCFYKMGCWKQNRA